MYALFIISTAIHALLLGGALFYMSIIGPAFVGVAALLVVLDLAGLALIDADRDHERRWHHH